MGRVFWRNNNTNDNRRGHRKTKKEKKNRQEEEKMRRDTTSGGWRDEGTIAHSEKCDSGGLKMSNVSEITLTTELGWCFKPNNSPCVLNLYVHHDSEKKCSNGLCFQRFLQMLWQNRQQFLNRFWCLCTCIHCVLAWEVRKLSCGCHSFTV